jgi:hypothetical protein
MDFLTFSQRKALDESLDSFEIIDLNPQAFEELFVLLEDKKIDCPSKNSKQELSENPIFLAFVKKTLERVDPSSKSLPASLLTSLILDFLESPSVSSKDLQRLLPKHQLMYIISQSKIPKVTQEELNNTISYYLEQYPDDYPYNKLIGFIWSKHSLIKNYLSKERLRDYISLSFLVFNPNENINFSSYEIQKKLESSKNDSEIFNEISTFIEKKVNQVRNYFDKVMVLMNFYSDFLSASQNLKKGKKIKIFKISVWVSFFLIKLLDSQKRFVKPEKEKQVFLMELEIKEKIFQENLNLFKFFSMKREKFQLQIKKIKEIEDVQLNLKKEEIIENTLQYFSKSPNNFDQVKEFEKSSKQREKILEKIRQKSQELYHLNSIHNKKIIKTKNLFKNNNGIKELLQGNYLKTEEELYRKNRDLSMKIKMIQSETRKIIEKREFLMNEAERKITWSLSFEVFLSCLFSFLLGIFLQNSLVYLKVN